MHTRAKHLFVQPREPVNPPPWLLEEVLPPLPEDFDVPMDVDAHAGNQGERKRPEWEYHTLLCGEFHRFHLRN